MGLECQTVMKRLASAYIRFALRNAVGKVLRTALAASDGEAEASDGEAEASDGEAEVDAEEVDVDAEEAEEAEEVVVEEAAAEHPPEPAAWLTVSGAAAGSALCFRSEIEPSGSRRISEPFVSFRPFCFVAS